MSIEFDASIGDGFNVRITADLDSDGDIDSLDVFSAKTGESLEPLIYGTRLWDECWDKALTQTASSNRPNASRMRDMRAACHDTPFAM